MRIFFNSIREIENEVSIIIKKKDNEYILEM